VILFLPGSNLSNPRGSGLRELLEQLMIMQWENARVSSERPLALIIVKLNRTAKILANYLARCPQLAKRNVKTTFVDGQCFCCASSLNTLLRSVRPPQRIEPELNLHYCFAKQKSLTNKKTYCAKKASQLSPFSTKSIPSSMMHTHFRLEYFCCTVEPR
jgi:hypothetical protein